MRIVELGHVVHYVADTEGSRHFYRDVLGFREVLRKTPPYIATFSSGRTHHELLLIEVWPHAAKMPPSPRLGLHHIGFKVGDSIDKLREARDGCAPRAFRSSAAPTTAGRRACTSRIPTVSRSSSTSTAIRRCGVTIRIFPSRVSRWRSDVAADRRCHRAATLTRASEDGCSHRGHGRQESW